MNTGKNYRELSDDELNQVAGGGPVAHQALGYPVSVGGDLNYYVPKINAQNAILPPWAQNLLAS
jgi:bacteriocin-like protein